MTKYDELTKLAQVWVRQRFLQRERAGADIYRIVELYSAFLGIPANRVSYANVDNDFNAKGETVDVWRKLRMRLFSDGYWGCIVEIHYGDDIAEEYLKERIKLAVRRQGFKLLVKVGFERQIFEIQRADDAAFSPLLEHLFNTTTALFKSGGSPPNITIGFIQQQIVE